VKILQSSGNRALDASAQRAILDAAPFTQLPPQFAHDTADIEFHFARR
jgi:TonB family protein